MGCSRPRGPISQLGKCEPLAYSHTGRWLIPLNGGGSRQAPWEIFALFLLRLTVNNPSSLINPLCFPCCECERQPKGIFFQTSRVGTTMPGLITQCTCLSVYFEVCSPQCHGWLWMVKNKTSCRDFPGGPVAETPHSQCRVWSSIPGQGTRPQMLHLKCLHAAAKDPKVPQLRPSAAK